MAFALVPARPAGTMKAERAKADQQQQLRFIAIDDGKRAQQLENKRRKVQMSRRAWLTMVEQYTWTHRSHMAARHATRAWYALQPNHEQVVPKPFKKPPEPEHFRMCGCGKNRPKERDVFGEIDEGDGEKHSHEHHGLQQCDHCHGIVDPRSVTGWHDYAIAIMRRADLTWCDRSCGEMYRGRRKGIDWCSYCDGPVSPHPLEASNGELHAHYRRLVEVYYTPVSYKLTWEAYLYAKAQHEAREENGHPGTPEENADRDAALAAAVGVSGPKRMKGPQKVGDPIAPNGSTSTYRWHKSREKGQLEKIQKVLECGAESMLHACTACGTAGPSFKLRCDNHRLCLYCREARVQRLRQRFEQRQKSLLQQLWKDPLRLTSTRYKSVIVDGNPDNDLKVPKFGGKWSERFLTLTIPHTGNPRDDVRELQRAWNAFWLKLKEHVRRDLLKHEAPDTIKHLMGSYLKYVRVVEITPGSEADGHAHLHVWMLSPFIHHEMLRHYWGSSIGGIYRELLEQAGATRTVDEVIDQLPESRKRFAGQLRGYLVTRRGRNGRPLERVWFPMVHIVKVASGAMGAELVKYLIKDGEKRADGSLELMDPELFAKIYAALEGVRAIAASRGFLTPEQAECHCAECGGIFKRWIEPTKAEPDARGPPGQLELSLEGGHGETTDS